jgi:hypothetical protein
MAALSSFRNYQRGVLGPVCLGFFWLSTKISHQAQPNRPASLVALPKPPSREKAPIEVLPAAFHITAEPLYAFGHIVCSIYRRLPPPDRIVRFRTRFFPRIARTVPAFLLPMCAPPRAAMARLRHHAHLVQAQESHPNRVAHGSINILLRPDLLIDISRIRERNSSTCRIVPSTF